MGEDPYRIPQENKGAILSRPLSPRIKEREYYCREGRAGEFDLRSRSPMSQTRYELVASELRRYIKKGPILEIGCGTGRLLIEIARQESKLHLTGIDISGEMVALARVNSQKEGLSGRIDLRELPAEELSSFQDSSFQLVLSHASFSGWLRPVEILEEIARVLEPGGFLFISDWNRASPMDSISALMRRALNEPEHLERIRMAFEAAYTEREFKSFLSGSPFEIIDFHAEDHWMTAVLCSRAFLNSI